MENLEVQEAFLGYLYSKNFEDKDPCLNTIDKWVKASKIDRTVFWKQYEYMIKSDLIKFVQDEGIVRLSPRGTLYAEKAGLAPADLIIEIRKVRKQLMLAMANRLNSAGPIVAVNDLIHSANLKGNHCLGNLQLLVGMGYANWQVPKERLSISSKVYAKTAALGQAA